MKVFSFMLFVFRIKKGDLCVSNGRALYMPQVALNSLFPRRPSRPREEETDGLLRGEERQSEGKVLISLSINI